MDSDRSWHEQDAFWETFEAALFTPRLWDEAVDDVEALLALCQPAAGARVLDMCCGPGRHSLELCRRGFQVTGVDRTRAYLEQAQQRADREGLTAQWIEEDVRRFQREAAFDLCINLYTSVGYFDDPADDLKLVQNVRRSLAPGGQFVLELVGKEILARVFEEQEWNELESGGFLLVERWVTDDWGRIHNRWILIRDGQVTQQRFSHRLFSAEELRRLLLAGGFGRVEIFGDLEGTPYDHEARRLVAVASEG